MLLLTISSYNGSNVTTLQYQMNIPISESRNYGNATTLYFCAIPDLDSNRAITNRGANQHQYITAM